MKYSEEYYNKTLANKPSRILQKFLDMKLDENLKEKTAIDLGCGAGNDVICLLEKGYKVTAIDKEEKVVDIIKSRTSNTEKVDFIIEEFEKIDFEKTNLIVSNFSLSFCNPKYFDTLMNKIIYNINSNGYFVR